MKCDLIFISFKNYSGCGAVRLAYTAGGRVVAGSNPVIPTNIFSFLVFKINLHLTSISFNL